MGTENKWRDNAGGDRERREMGGREGARQRGGRERERASGSNVERRRGWRRMSGEGWVERENCDAMR